MYHDLLCFVSFCNNVVSVGWSSFCFTEAGLCRHWQRNVRTCIWGVCIICTCKCWNSKWNLGLNGFNLKFKSQFLLFPNPNVTIHDHESSSLLIRTYNPPALKTPVLISFCEFVASKIYHRHVSLLLINHVIIPMNWNYDF